MLLVLDASSAIEFLLNTDAGKRIATRVENPAVSIHVPHLIDLEIMHVLRRYTHRGLLSGAHGALALAQWRAVDLERYAHEPFLDRIWQLRDNLSAYDAVYVALTEALAAVLVTGDRHLVRAPGLRIRVEPA